MEEDAKVELESNPEGTEDNPGSYWRIWNCIDALLSEDSSMMKEPYTSTTKQVASILRQWGKNWAGIISWASVLNKRTLHHEAEESIVALYHLRQWMQQPCENDNDKNGFIAVDVCGGKGIFSMILSYMASEYWQPMDHMATLAESPQHRTRQLKKIILLEKATTKDINWDHIKEANDRSQGDDSFPVIEIWPGTNLHDYDKVLEKFQSLSTENQNMPLALAGIHLCKMLGPSFVSLVNGLGPQQCPYVCLAPCCLPRVVTNPKSVSPMIPINSHETKEERESRLDHNRRKNAARNHYSCYLCESKKHWVKECPKYKMLDDDKRRDIMEAALASIPCWLCGVVGHWKRDCPTPEGARITTRHPPSVEMNVLDIITSPSPFEVYCGRLAGHVDLGVCHPIGVASNAVGGDQPRLKELNDIAPKLQVIEAGLTDTSAHKENWNSRRKSIFIIATR